MVVSPVGATKIPLSPLTASVSKPDIQCHMDHGQCGKQMTTNCRDGWGISALCHGAWWPSPEDHLRMWSWFWFRDLFYFPKIRAGFLCSWLRPCLPVVAPPVMLPTFITKFPLRICDTWGSAQDTPWPKVNRAQEPFMPTPTNKNHHVAFKDMEPTFLRGKCFH